MNLPIPRDTGFNTGKPVYTENQVKAYAKRMVMEAMKDVLDTCEELHGLDQRHPLYQDGYDDALRHVTEFITARSRPWMSQPSNDTQER